MLKFKFKVVNDTTIDGEDVMDMNEHVEVDDNIANEVSMAENDGVKYQPEDLSEDDEDDYNIDVEEQEREKLEDIYESGGGLEELKGSWEFAFVLHFLETFKEAVDLPTFTADVLMMFTLNPLLIIFSFRNWNLLLYMAATSCLICTFIC
jgi:hypothetical protein